MQVVTCKVVFGKDWPGHNTPTAKGLSRKHIIEGLKVGRSRCRDCEAT